MTSRMIKRVKYFFGKILGKEDFEKEQDYHLDNKRSKQGKVKRTGVAKAKIKSSSTNKAPIKGVSVKKDTDN